MRRLWTIIGVNDVAASVRWYQTLLGLPHTAPAHDYFGQIQDADETVLLCLHSWGATNIRHWQTAIVLSPVTACCCFSG